MSETKHEIIAETLKNKSNLLWEVFVALILLTALLTSSFALAQTNRSKIQTPPPLIMANPLDNKDGIERNETGNDKSGIEYNNNFDVKSSDEKADSNISAQPHEKQKSFDDGSDHYEIAPYYRDQPAPVLKKKLRDGTKVYKTKTSPQHYAGGFRIGPYTPTNLKGDSPGITYNNIYKTNPVALGVDFEWQFYKGMGRLGLQGGFGFFTASGNGRFLNPALSGIISETVMTLYAFPMQTSLLYHLQFSDKQIFVPFGGGGFDYTGLLESRDDKDKLADKLKYGGGASVHWVAGLEIQLDFIDRDLIWQLDSDYGINHVYLTADFRQLIGLSSVFDFSGTYYEGGILFEF